jgi:hypothetical protein
VRDRPKPPKFGRHEVRCHGFDNGYDSDTDLWIRQQIEAMEPPGEPR